MKYDKQRKALAHAKAVENAVNYLVSLRGGSSWKRPIEMLRLPIRLSRDNILPPLEKGARL